MKTKHLGIVAEYDKNSGSGWIKSDEFINKIYFSYENVPKELKSVAPGANVEFELQYHYHGNIASNVKVVNSTPNAK